MVLPTPQEIRKKADQAYQRFLKSWIRGEGDKFFPWLVRVDKQLDYTDISEMIKADELLTAQSKAERNWGYTVHKEIIRKRQFGKNPVPTRITIDTQEDLLQLVGKKREFASASKVVSRLRGLFPSLEDWMIKNLKKLHTLADDLDDLIHVAEYFKNHPVPDCYLRQIPVQVDTKFIERHESILTGWLDALLPPSAIDPTEKKFVRRFGLRDGQSHWTIRILDPGLQQELRLPFDEFSLPLRTLTELNVSHAVVFVMENDMNLLTMPLASRGFAICGEGNAVTRLQVVKFFHDNVIFYWGDIDVEGFHILSSLRKLFPHVQSIMMDRKTLYAHTDGVVNGNNSTKVVPTNLDEEETATCLWCMENNHRLEQEKIRQPYVDEMITKAMRQVEIGAK